MGSSPVHNGAMTPVIRGISSMATRQLLAELATDYEQRTGCAVRIESVGGVDAGVTVIAIGAAPMRLCSSAIVVGIILVPTPVAAGTATWNERCCRQPRRRRASHRQRMPASRRLRSSRDWL